MAVKIRKLGEIKTEDIYTHMLVMGPSGAGKTRLIATLPEEDLVRSLLIDPDKGIAAILGRADEIDFADIETYDDFAEVFTKAYLEPTKWKWLVIDNLHEINRKLIDVYTDEDSMLVKKGEWQIISARLGKLLRLIRDIKMNVLVTCLNERDKDENSGITMIQPSLTGKLAMMVPAFFDQVVYYHVDPESNERYLQTRIKKNMCCKDRWDALAEHEVPDMKVITNKIIAKVTELRSKKK